MNQTLKSLCEIGGVQTSHIFQQNTKITHLGKLGKIEEAIKVFIQMPCRNIVTYNSMISAYAKNSRIGDARHLFDKMRHKNLISWNTMIAGYLHNNQVTNARELFDRMPQRDNYTWTLMITCYTRNMELNKAKDLFNLLPDKNNIACWNAMIAGYSKNKMYDDALRILYQMPNKDFMSWNSMLSGYTSNGEMNFAVNFFNEMQHKDVVSWNLMVDGFLDIGDLNSAWDFFQNIPNPNAVSYVTMMCGFAKNNQTTEARKLFDQMRSKNIVSWNAMLSAYVNNFQIDEAVRLFDEMPQRNVISWTTMINGYIRIGKICEAEKLSDMMPYKDIEAQTTLLSGYIQHGMLDQARKTFDNINTRDIVCWNTMIAGYVHYKRMDEAVFLFEKMYRKDIVTWNTIIAGYSQAGQMNKAIEIFEKMGRKNIVSWNSLISGFNHNGLCEDALRIFSLMARDDMKPDQSTFVSTLSSCSSLAFLQFGKQLHQISLKTGYTNDRFVSNSLISMYAKCGQAVSARNVFHDIGTTVTDVIAWNSLIFGYALNGCGENAIMLLEDMLIEGVKPDHVTFLGLLSACNHSGLIDSGLKLFNSMLNNYGLEPLEEHYACVIDLLGRAGRLEEAFEMVGRMKTEGSVGIWGSLLSGCRLHKNLELGKVAAKKLSEIEPCKGSDVVLLSSLQVEAGRWCEAERTRMLIEERKARKEKGCSWIEDKRQLWSFPCYDDYVLQNTEILGILKTLNEHISKFDYAADETAVCSFPKLRYMD
ncbi:pentatricopeptide repeat-containing protein At2g35030, mitochondrial-like [Impatiens glandulifera]|uniref:pentatricopeptide repeat-containing protein At2g35030, mitochondrial-like n=1 Tax=Impatiens glandulifera TaxID=253017 RepID=UPI001FB1A09F|nr:pentatricopeptide repeat-containing protein At2g35030, mitochondrial-like [Impatiens glandulifera]